MNELNSSNATNWYAFLSLVMQLAFLVAAVAFVRGFLRTMRGFQEQLGALLKSSIAAVHIEADSAAGTEKPSLAEASPYWLAPAEPRPAMPAPTNTVRTNRFVVARRRVTLWLQAPMRSTGVAPWRLLINWLQAPAGR